MSQIVSYVRMKTWRKDARYFKFFPVLTASVSLKHTTKSDMISQVSLRQSLTTVNS